jgi:hypothetical protein
VIKPFDTTGPTLRHFSFTACTKNLIYSRHYPSCVAGLEGALSIGYVISTYEWFDRSIKKTLPFGEKDACTK